MTKLSQEELDLVQTIQESLAGAKHALRRASSASRKMMRVNLEAGRTKEANAAMRLQGALVSARGDIIQAHADASDALCDCFEDGGGIVVFGGGGR